MEIKIKALTPIWTGGVEGKPDRLHETGIIGSMRWWYEAIVRGLGGYVCDPTSEKRCELSGKEKTREERLAKLCPACYLFGCGGWKRRFVFHIENAPTIPLHFRTSVNMNKNWLKRIFGGEGQNIDSLSVFYGDMTVRIIIRTDDVDYISSQLIMLFNFISRYGGLGAKLQYGFGQIRVLESESVSGDSVIRVGLKELKKKIQANVFSEGQKVNTPYTLENFVSLDYDLPSSYLKIFMQNNSHIGHNTKFQENRYIPCAFDLRYKGSEQFGMRKWLKEDKDWSESDEPKQLGQLDKLLGPRSRWKSNGKWKEIDDNLRTASRLYFGMPYKSANNDYRLRIFGFAPPDVLEPHKLKELCEEYMQHIFSQRCNPVRVTLGSDIIKGLGGT
ncbi:MAG: RAMP superfamily protein [Candidatus Methanoperedenaceae archaeon GB50]|nr:MAG: RAMP superfamily protein [Candidatus Methanoperedenaceae archaeon GB50]